MREAIIIKAWFWRMVLGAAILWCRFCRWLHTGADRLCGRLARKAGREVISSDAFSFWDNPSDARFNRMDDLIDADSEHSKESNMKPMYTMLILGIAGLPVSLLIAWILSLLHVPAWGQLAAIVVCVLICMFTGALCWSARMGEEMP